MRRKAFIVASGQGWPKQMVFTLSVCVVRFIFDVVVLCFLSPFEPKERRGSIPVFFLWLVFPHEAGFWWAKRGRSVPP